MDRYILTGAPGAGKTTTARLLAAAGHTVVAEAATDLIEAAQADGQDAPWEQAAFCEAIAALQRDRQIAADALPGPVQYFDRSPVCTLALARFTNQPVGPALAAELDRIRTERVYRPRVLMLDLLGFVVPTAVRRVDLAQAQRFEDVHVQAYTEHGFTVERIPAAPPRARAALLHQLTCRESHA
ncbi:AAA family ATPase [Glycomyces harbinensis]|uniref:Predicted ATPase n=1 Tax=Glycomyces harbinensis TaxID=58114 RepID=A0A1G6RBU8_9ACTN|nr:AAA family ATPase [Glycomyces harbinensis]SDD01883.1 Predicted ATPase [Glycomyces harbinensis]